MYYAVLYESVSWAILVARFLLRDHNTVPRTSSQMAFPGEACPILVYSMCVSASFRTFVGAAAAYVWLSCHFSCSYFRSMPSRLLRTSVDRSDEALLGCCADDQISIYLSSFSPYFKPDIFLSHPLHPSPPCPIFHLHPHLLALSSSLPISSSTRAMHHATTSDLLAFPLKQQPLSQPPGIGLSTSSAASICA
jgi:hypothetical protein